MLNENQTEIQHTFRIVINVDITRENNQSKKKSNLNKVLKSYLVV